MARAKVEIIISKNEGDETYRISFGLVGTWRGVARLTLEKANAVAQDLHDEVIRQQTGRPVIVRNYA
ncbi:hypothetical protein WS67_12095 [Burkholderia singularis]|uniref:Uncharacterized protein n=1 Tax=Burkholderia singularis TaxID=1503053 RepID=A0A103E2M8_9BURK|nr:MULTISPECIES: hypothetical protein [Burkholderia]KVE27237.1 hypothetical protein WS67_12095 [Burkholderia singularis]KVE33731.1 hypothetical protein WS68_11190 [Burkholderia sp. TSV86]